ncbi:hypothetical protein P872_02000 [Rhodonellum psychrophilum GCM71 = DSM 17998]|uniref:Sialidase domain-containing protein n=2 Tax=Rhodonellum TaxID=336827 RepID=U5C6I9_9BACT|nr:MULTISPECIES: hypothetical protein [Rhodonellum]ERM83812.1 hypothetical protein P872_02000 [Rhodonellum psychrophilum GCM71 = DSM 17998]SDY65839.1 hypothetical protein SAMN05444412_102133 [Rhodonellum ikkaensis]
MNQQSQGLSIAFLFIWLFISCSEKIHEAKDQTPETSVTMGSPESNFGEPYLYTSTKGVTYLSWIEKTGGKSELKYATWVDDSWSDPITIATGENWFVNWADYPQISTFENGNLIAFFLEKSGEGPFAYDIKVTLSENGTDWSDPFTLHDDGTETEHGFVSFAAWGDQMFVAWLDGRGTGGGSHENTNHDHHGHQGAMTLRGALISEKGIKTEEWELDNRVCDCCQTTAVVTENGPVVVYRDRSEAEIRDMGIVRFENGNWTTPLPLYSDFWKVAGCPVNGPRAASLGNSIAVTWYSAANEKPEVKVVFSNDGGKSFGKPIKIDLGKTIGRLDLEMLDDNTALITWMEEEEILARKVHASGKTEAVISIAKSSSKRASGFPQMTKNGNAILFAWTDAQGDQSVIKTKKLIMD